MQQLRVGLARKLEPAFEASFEALVEPERLFLRLLLLFPLTGDGQQVVGHLDSQLLLLEAGHLELDDVLAVGLVDIGRRQNAGSRPCRIVEQSLEPSLDRIEVTQG